MQKGSLFGPLYDQAWALRACSANGASQGVDWCQQQCHNIAHHSDSIHGGQRRRRSWEEEVACEWYYDRRVGLGHEPQDVPCERHKVHGWCGRVDQGAGKGVCPCASTLHVHHNVKAQESDVVEDSRGRCGRNPPPTNDPRYHAWRGVRDLSFK